MNETLSKNHGQLMSLVSGVLGRLAQIALSILVTPFVISKIGVTSYGLFSTLTSVSGAVSFADLGIGNGLIAEIARTRGSNSQNDVGVIVWTALAVVTAVSISLLAGLIGLIEIFGLTLFLGSDQVIREYELPVRLFLAGCVINLPLTLGTRILAGLGYQPYANLHTSALGIISSLAAVTASLIAPSVTNLLLWTIASILLINAGLLVYILIDVSRSGNAVKRFDVAIARRLITTGSHYVVMGVAVVVSSTLDSVLLSRLLGYGATAEWNVTNKLFLVAGTFIGYYSAPLWPMVASARSQGDNRLAARLLKKTMTVSVVAGAMINLLCLLAAPNLVPLLSHGAFSVNYPLAIALAFTSTIQIFGSTMSIFLNGIGQTSTQVRLALTYAFAGLIIKGVFAMNFGVGGFVAGNGLSYLLIIVPVMFRHYSRETRVC